MNATEHTLWVSAIIGGFVVVLAVAALLTLLIYLDQAHRPAGST